MSSPNVIAGCCGRSFSKNAIRTRYAVTSTWTGNICGSWSFAPRTSLNPAISRRTETIPQDLDEPRDFETERPDGALLLRGEVIQDGPRSGGSKTYD